jgi:hypothetical protein
LRPGPGSSDGFEAAGDLDIEGAGAAAPGLAAGVGLDPDGLDDFAGVDPAPGGAPAFARTAGAGSAFGRAADAGSAFVRVTGGADRAGRAVEGTGLSGAGADAVAFDDAPLAFKGATDRS